MTTVTLTDEDTTTTRHLPIGAVRVPVLMLDRALTAALPHAGRDADVIPTLYTVRLRAHGDDLSVVATDRYTMLRDVIPGVTVAADWTFLLNRDDAVTLRRVLKAAVRGVKKETRGLVPVDLAVEEGHDPETGEVHDVLHVLATNVDVRFRAQQHAPDAQYPHVDNLIEQQLTVASLGAGTFDVDLNPLLLERVAAAGRKRLRFRKRADGVGPVVVTSSDDGDDQLVVLIMPIRTERSLSK